MDDKALNKRLRSKVAMHMLFGLGGAVVIIGALFKILHLEIGPITGGLVLGIGLGTEALIFTVSAFNTGEIKEEHEDFVKKAKGSSPSKSSGGSGDQGLSSKIDEFLKTVRDELKIFQEEMNKMEEPVEVPPTIEDQAIQPVSLLMAQGGPAMSDNEPRFETRSPENQMFSIDTAIGNLMTEYDMGLTVDIEA